MTRHLVDDGKVVARAADRQVYRWIREGEVLQRLRRTAEQPQVQDCIRPYITLSREVGSRSGEVAQRLGIRLTFQVLDKELLEFMAEHYHLPRQMLEVVDETTANWFHEALAKWLDHRAVTQAEYVARLGQFILLAAQYGEAIFVGRGAQFLLPPERGLRVRIVGSRESRVARVMEVHSMNRGEAQQFVETTDRGRAEFVRRYFGVDVGDPHLYDLVVNMDDLDPRRAAELITSAFRLAGHC